MRVLVPPNFARRANREGLEDVDLQAAIERAERGIVDAQIGADLIKQRVPRHGQGRSGGFRTIIAYRRGERAVFLHRFAKNAKDSLTVAESNAFRALARELGA